MSQLHLWSKWNLDLFPLSQLLSIWKSVNFLQTCSFGSRGAYLLGNDLIHILKCDSYDEFHLACLDYVRLRVGTRWFRGWICRLLSGFCWADSTNDQVKHAVWLVSLPTYARWYVNFDRVFTFDPLSRLYPFCSHAYLFICPAEHQAYFVIFTSAQLGYCSFPVLFTAFSLPKTTTRVHRSTIF